MGVDSKTGKRLMMTSLFRIGGDFMARITLEVILKIAEIIGSIVIVISDTLKGGKTENDNAGNSKEK